MNKYKNENSFKKSFHSHNNKNSKHISISNFKLIHRIFNSINISLLFLIFILSFLSFNSQRKWTIIYKNIGNTRSINNNLLDYISKVEEFYINKIETLKTFKKTTPNDLIYLDKQIIKKEKNNFNRKLKYIHEGLKDSKYQRGY